MYSVYINHFKNPGSANEEIIDTEELMFTVPGDGPFHILKPSVKSTEDSADNFSFSMESNSMYYDSILPLKTMFRVEYDGDIIFYGRALAPSTSSVFHTKNVTCEGKYVFLNDTYYEGKQESHRSKITISDYYDRIIENHNAMAPTKPFARGIVEVELPDKTEKYEPTSWSQSFSLIGNLTSGYGGHIRARYEGETVYLDWYKYYLRDLGDYERPSVEIGKNILDISSETRIDDIFSRLIPIGDTNKDGKPLYLDGYEYEDKDGNTQTFSGKVFPVSMIRDLYTDEELTDEFHDYRDYRDVEDNFGIIYKTMSFGDCDTQKKLFDETKKWIKEAYFGLATSFSVKAVDFHLLNNEVPKILLGDCVDVSFLMTINGVSTRVTKKLVCKSVTYDLYNPENNMYTFGIPTDVLNKNRDRKSSKNTVSDTTAPKPNPTSREEEDKTVTWEKVWRTIGDKSRFDPDYDPQFYGDAAFDSFEENGELEGTVYCVDPDEIETGDPQELFEKRFRARLIGLITIPEYTPNGLLVQTNAVCLPILKIDMLIM